MWMKWFPWRFLLKSAARKHGFIDPIKVLTQLQGFAQPSEVAAPIELLRLAAVLQARGLLNSQVIQHNLDWIWPFWVTKQFDPHDPAFIPRAFSLTHINLTHRNWTAIGTPGCSEYPLIDPRGLLTPLYDGWSIDSWIVAENGDVLTPSRIPKVTQEWVFKGNLAVETKSEFKNLHLLTRAEVFMDHHVPICRLSVRGWADKKAKLVISLRPQNPEGVSLVHEIEELKNEKGWKVNGDHHIYFNQRPDRYEFSNYKQGDVFQKILTPNGSKETSCEVGMATGAAVFDLEEKKEREILIAIPIKKNPAHPHSFHVPSHASIEWKKSIEEAAKIQIPDQKIQFLYEAALRTLVLHSPKEIYAGPYTYKHFWFRDAAIILHAMLAAGLISRAEDILSSFPERQEANGYFRSQDGEWDSNGQVLWILGRFFELTGHFPKGDWKKVIIKAAKWIQKKRLTHISGTLHDGLYPPGFSAEHLGPNDYYYWDDFWGVKGLMAASELLDQLNEKELSEEFANEARDFLAAIEKSLEQVSRKLGHKGMPASPYRRMDAGAIGSIAVSYPLQLWRPGDVREIETVDYLLRKCFTEGGFFHDVSHSGINPYLTLHVAQSLLRQRDPRYFNIMKNLANLASPTGQWPEAIHPKNFGGCMGDGQHVWAAAEWILMVRNCFVREEPGKLIVGSGIHSDWLKEHNAIFFGPVPTNFGPILISFKLTKNKVHINWKAEWRSKIPILEVGIANAPPVNPKEAVAEVVIDLGAI